MNLAQHRPLQQFADAPRRLVHVHMRGGPVGRDDVGVARQIGTDVGVQIERDADRNSRPDDVAQPPHELALGVLEVFGHHGAVQHHQQPIDWQRVPERREDDVAEMLEGVPGHGSARRGVRHQRMHQGPAKPVGKVQDGAHFAVRAAVGRNNLAVTVITVRPLEPVQVGGQ